MRVDLVVTSLEPWDAVWRRNQHLVAGLLRTDPALRVLFVEPATDPLHAALGAAVPRRGRGLRRAADDLGPLAAVEGLAGVADDRLWLLGPTKWLPRRLDPGVDDRWARQVLRAARHLGLDDPVLWVNDPTGALLVAATGWPSLYDVTDDWTLADRPPEQLQRLRAQEQVLLERCAEVVVCSPALAASKGAARPVTLVPNGVDTAAYADPGARPDDLPPGRTVLYAGTLHADRLDVDLCVGLCHALAAGEGAGSGVPATLVLVGPDALDRNEGQRLRDAGALVLGARDRRLVPAHLAHADVLVVPHAVTPFTDSLDPIKLYEYAAAGRPVVATPVAGFRDTDDPLVRVVDAGAFAGAVLDALCAAASEPAHADRAARLAGIDWSDRVHRMGEVLGRLGALR